MPVVVALLVALVLTAGPARAVLASVGASWPSSTLERGKAAAVTGRVTGVDAGSTVLLQQKVLGGWMTVERTSLDSRGTYRLPIPTWWTGERTYRVATAGLGATSSSWDVRVVPEYTPQGSADQHRYSLSSPTRWNPCQVIGYRVYAEQARRGWKKDVRGAFSRITAATGFRFAFRGTTGRIPQNNANDWFPSDTDIVVAWAKPSQSSLLRKYPGAEGVGAALSTSGWYNGDGSSTYRIKRGMVVIDSRTRRPAGFGSGVTRGDVLIHEIGHTMGMSHVGEKRQMMYPYLTSGKARLGRGDITGMQKRGARLGCLTQTPALRGTAAPAADTRLVTDR